MATELDNRTIDTGFCVGPNILETEYFVADISTPSTSGWDGYFEEHTPYDMAIRLQDKEENFNDDLG